MQYKVLFYVTRHKIANRRDYYRDAGKNWKVNIFINYKFKYLMNQNS